jgi:para-aminobenzoate synthetase/4-amino-4-deoxychorismate lyase
MLSKAVLRVPDEGDWLIFSEPVDRLSAIVPEAVPEVLQEVERRVSQDGLFAAGFISYEAAPGFDPAFVTHTSSQLPPLCFSLFNEPQRLQALPRDGDELPAEWTMSINHPDYLAMVERIKTQIERGNTYQINYTVRMSAAGIVDPWAVFTSAAANAPYAAYLETDDFAIVSGSPELFFRIADGQIVCRPMKGTARRGVTLEEDQELSNWLRTSEKNQAENIMITDMVRNDLGRVAQPGTVKVSDLCSLEKYPTLWQLTSTVTAQSSASVSDVMTALFPSASVTGAPKVSSMKIIADIEEAPREIYTGTIGYIAPDGSAQFSVAIRTALVARATGTAAYGVGGGIVADSEPEQEYTECLTKARMIRSGPWPREFELLETMLWTPETGFFLLDRHLQRMRDSAEYFGFSFDASIVEDVIDRLGAELDRPSRRVRLLLSSDGRVRYTNDLLPAVEESVTRRIGLASIPIDADDPFLHHKTTRRNVYKRALATVPDCDDVLLWNTAGNITETSTANVVAKLGGELITPSSRSGLLRGTYRQWLLDKGEIEERDIHLDELPKIESFFLINSVRGRYPAELQLVTSKP